MHARGLELPDGCVQSISLQANEAMIAAYRFLALMPLAVARHGVNREKLAILPLEGTRFLETVQLFYIETVEKQLSTLLLTQEAEPRNGARLGRAIRQLRRGQRLTRRGR